MAFVSIGQKYGFVSIGDAQRKEIADAREEERTKLRAQADAEKKQLLDKADAEKRQRAQMMLADGFTKEQSSKYSGAPLDEL